MPSRFTWQDADVYLPLKLPGGANDLYDPTMRLRPGVTHAAANAELQPLLEQFAKETPSHFPKKFRVHVKGLNEQYVSHLGHSLFLLFGAVGLLLVISCANVSILLLARGTARQQELPVLAFSVAAAIVTGALAGISPAFQFSRPNLSLYSCNRGAPQAASKENGRTAYWSWGRLRSRCFCLPLRLQRLTALCALSTPISATIRRTSCPGAFRCTRTHTSVGRIVLTISSSSVSTSRPCRKWFRRAFRPTPRRPGTKTTGASRFWGGPATNSGARV